MQRERPESQCVVARGEREREGDGEGMGQCPRMKPIDLFWTP